MLFHVTTCNLETLWKFTSWCRRWATHDYDHELSTLPKMCLLNTHFLMGWKFEINTKENKFCPTFLLTKYHILRYDNSSLFISELYKEHWKFWCFSFKCSFQCILNEMILQVSFSVSHTFVTIVCVTWLYLMFKKDLSYHLWYKFNIVITLISNCISMLV